MDREEKQQIFEPLLKDFETETFAEYFKDMVASQLLNSNTLSEKVFCLTILFIFLSNF